MPWLVTLLLTIEDEKRSFEISKKQRERNSPFVHQACVVLHQVFAEGTKEAEALVGERLWCKHKPLQQRRAESCQATRKMSLYF